MQGLLFFTTNSFLDRLFMSVFQERDADKTADAIKFVWLIYFLFVTIETIPGPFLLCVSFSKRVTNSAIDAIKFV